MSSSNQVVPLDPSRLSAIHSTFNTNNENGGLQSGQTVMIYDKDGNTYLQNNNVQVNAGNARDVGISVTVRNTYPARYNFAVKQYNSIPDDEASKKKQIRGGHFLMYRFVMVLAFLIAIATAGISVKIKAVVTVNIVISLAYIVLSIYNIVIYKQNGSLFSRRMIHDNRMTKSNDYFKVPINTTVSQANIIASEHANVVAGLKNTYNHLSEIDVMVYNEYYVRTFTYFPWKKVIKHIIVFSLTMVIGIILAAITTTS